MTILEGKPMVVGYHHFRKPPIWELIFLMVGDILSFHHLNDALIAFCRLGILDKADFRFRVKVALGKLKGVLVSRCTPLEI